MLIVGVEDSRSLITARLRLYNADLTRIHFVDAANIGEKNVLLVLPDHVGILEEAIIEHAVGVIYVDALFSHLAIEGEGRMAHQVRRCLQPIGDMCERRSAAFLGMRHWIKSTGSAMSRAIGSVEFGDYARSVFALGPHPNNDKLVVCSHSKVNAAKLSGAVAFEIVEHNVEDDNGKPWEVSVAEHVAVAEGVTSDDLTMKTPSDPDERKSAAEWLRDYLADGNAHLTSTVFAAATKAKAGERTTIWRAARSLGVIFGKTASYPSVGTWSLPGDDKPPADDGPRARAHETNRATTATTGKGEREESLFHKGLDSLCTVVARDDKCNDCATADTERVGPSKISEGIGGTPSEQNEALTGPVVAKVKYIDDCPKPPHRDAAKTFIPQRSASRFTVGARNGDATTVEGASARPAPSIPTKRSVVAPPDREAEDFPL